MKKTEVVFFLACAMTLPVSAEGFSSYEAPGFIDAFITFCSETYPEKARYYKQGILQSFSCDKTVSETEKMVSDIRNNPNAQVQVAYHRTFDETIKEFRRLTREQKNQVCEDGARAKTC